MEYTQIENTNYNMEGVKLQCIKPISKKDFVHLCESLKIYFDDTFSETDNEFSPECISEGGILFNKYKFPAYKSMRLLFTTKDGNTFERLYGQINTNIKNEWINDNTILINNNTFLKMRLKSFNNAPPWSVPELKLFLKCFQDYGLIVYNFPGAKPYLNSYYKNLHREVRKIFKPINLN